MGQGMGGVAGTAQCGRAELEGGGGDGDRLPDGEGVSSVRSMVCPVKRHVMRNFNNLF